MAGFPLWSRLVPNGIRERKTGQEPRVLISEGHLSVGGIWKEAPLLLPRSDTPYEKIWVACPLQPLVSLKLDHNETRIPHGRQTQQILLVILIESLHDQGEHPTKEDVTTKRIVFPCINDPIHEQATKVEGALLTTIMGQPQSPQL